MANYKRPDVSTFRFRFESKRVRNQEVIDSLVLNGSSYADIGTSLVGKIISNYNKKIRDVSMSNYLGAELPLDLGVIFLAGCKVENGRKFINHSASAQAEKIVYSDLEETGGNILKIFYVNSVSRYNLKYKELWSFTATKTFKSVASKYFKENWRKCLGISQKQDVSEFFKKERKQKISYDNNRKDKYENYDDINIEL
jgi:hypothetical protein